jgi:glutaminyl-peptide cyclotransferase
LTDRGSHLIQLTWKAGIDFVYDRFIFTSERNFHYQGEGWGLTHDSTTLIMSDGSSVLRFLNPTSFQKVRRISVRDGDGRLIDQLNELEYVRGELYANIWHSDQIAHISPRTGRVVGWIGISGLIDKNELGNADAVLNGIAYDSKGDRLFVTGKLWPKLFEVKIVRYKLAN